MPRIDGIQYPDTYAEAMKDKALKAIFEKTCLKGSAKRLVTMLMVKSSFKPQSYYEEFIAPGAKLSVDGAGASVKAIALAHKLAEADNWDMKYWKKVYDDNRKIALLNLDVELKKMYGLKVFQEYHAKNVKVVDKKAKKDVKAVKGDVKIPDAMLKQLGISDKKDAQAFVAALKTDNNREAEKLADKIIKKEKKKEDRKSLMTKVRKMLPKFG